MKLNLSNNSLAVLLVFALVISVVGTWISVSYIGDLNQLTGLATSDTGNTTLTITSETSCTTSSDDVVAFGNLGKDETNQSEAAGDDYIILENDGNANIDVEVNITDNTTVLWDDSVPGGVIPNSYWMIRCANAQSGSCVNSTYVDVAGNHSLSILATGLQFADNADNITIAINVTVPSDESPAAKTGQVTFYCTAT
jgi:hypothetical protein